MLANAVRAWSLSMVTVCSNAVQIIMLIWINNASFALKIHPNAAKFLQLTYK